jgi:hypothetical protein
MDRIENLRNYRPENLPFGEDGTSGTRRPHFDIGEYLPLPKKGEIEFVRINLASTTGDVYSLRIKKEKTSYVITIVDEYQTVFTDYENEYDQIPTQGEIFDVIIKMNNGFDVESYWLPIIELNELDSIEQITDFIQFDSNMYPYLNDLFIDYLKRTGFKEEQEDVHKNIENLDLNLLSDLLNNIKQKNDWDSLMGTICFNIWNKTSHWFINSNDFRYIDVSFICALNLFQKWNNIYLSKDFSLEIISKDASPFVIQESNKLFNNLTNLKKFIEAVKETGYGEKETSKHFISIFTSELLNSEKFKDESINPMDYFQFGVEILCLFVELIKVEDGIFFNELLDIGDFEEQVEEIINDINLLNESEK